MTKKKKKKASMSGLGEQIYESEDVVLFPTEEPAPAAQQAAPAAVSQEESKAEGVARTRATVGDKFVLFRLGDSFFGLEVGRVREVVPCGEITRVPGAPPFVEGIINLRGEVTPVVNLSGKLAVDNWSVEQAERIVVVEHGEGWVGILVDDVSDVKFIAPEAIQDPGSVTGGDFLIGMVEVDDKFVLLLDAEELLRPEEAA